MEPEAGMVQRYHPFRIGRSEDSHNLTTHIELNRVILPTFHLLENHADTLGFGEGWGRVSSDLRRVIRCSPPTRVDMDQTSFCHCSALAGTADSCMHIFLSASTGCCVHSLGKISRERSEVKDCTLGNLHSYPQPAERSYWNFAGCSFTAFFLGSWLR